MQIRREGTVLFITDHGFYEPAPIPRRVQGRRSWVRPCIVVLTVLFVVACGLAGASNLHLPQL